jgi:hypothetical protein
VRNFAGIVRIIEDLKVARQKLFNLEETKAQLQASPLQSDGSYSVKIPLD